MSSSAAGKFQDHYKILGVDPKAAPDIIQLAYNALFAVYNAKTGTGPDSQKLEEITLASEVLGEPTARKMFDAVRGGDDERDISFTGMDFFNGMQNELDRRMTLLCVLYDVRCQNPRVPLITMRQLEKIVDMTELQIELALWYVKTLGFVTVDDKSKMLITAQGMDYLQSNAPDPSSIWRFLKNPSGPKPEEREPEVKDLSTANLTALSSAIHSFVAPAPERQPQLPQPFATPMTVQAPPQSSHHSQPIEILRPKTMSILRRASVSITEA